MPLSCCVFLVVSVEFLEAVRQQVQKFEVQYIGNLPVSRAMGETDHVQEAASGRRAAKGVLFLQVWRF